MVIIKHDADKRGSNSSGAARTVQHGNTGVTGFSWTARSRADTARARALLFSLFLFSFLFSSFGRGQCKVDTLTISPHTCGLACVREGHAMRSKRNIQLHRIIDVAFACAATFTLFRSKDRHLRIALLLTCPDLMTQRGNK